MIKLKTDCSNCVHNKVCRHKDNAKKAMEKLKKQKYSNIPDDDYDWDAMMNLSNVDIEFSCPDYKNCIVNIR